MKRKISALFLIAMLFGMVMLSCQNDAADVPAE